MLQKYEPRTGNDYIPTFDVLNFNEKYQAPEARSEETILELPSAASAGDVREVVRFLSRENASIRISELQTANRAAFSSRTN